MMQILILSKNINYVNPRYSIMHRGVFNEINDIEKAATAIAHGNLSRVIMLPNYGIGATLVANKIKGIRCARILDESTAYYSRLHNNANMAIIPLGIITESYAKLLIDIFLDTQYEEGRHNERIGSLDNIAQFYKEPVKKSVIIESEEITKESDETTKESEEKSEESNEKIQEVEVIV